MKPGRTRRLSGRMCPARGGNVRREILYAMCALVLLCAACSTAQQSPAGDNATPADASDVAVSASVDRTRAALDEPVRFTLRASCPEGFKVILPDIEPEITGLRIVDFGESGPDPLDGLLVYTKWFDLRADVAGTYIIPSLAVSAENEDAKRRIMTPQVFIQAGARLDRADNETMQDIIDIKPLALPPRDLRAVIIGAACAAAVLAAGLGAWLYVRRRRVPVRAPLKPAHVLALERLEQLERDGLAGHGDMHAFYVRLSDIFRHYLQERFGVPAVEQTRQELMRSLESLSGMDPAAVKAAGDFLLQADLVKFAKYAPGAGDARESLQQVRDIVAGTLPVPQAEVPLEAGRDAAV